jgi:SAM-dependent methyltransferase
LSTPDARSRFSPVAAAYGRGRPSYPPELIGWILAEAGLRAGDPVADVGCGTGIATRLLAERGLQVVGVDPSEAMLLEARAVGGGPRYVRGEAAATGLATGSLGLVTVAQALHWFELGAALPELRRVLRPGGSLAAFWNERASGDFMDEYNALLLRCSSEYTGRQRARVTMDAVRARADVVAVRERAFSHAQVLDWETLVDRVSSSSYVAHGVADRPGFEAALRELFLRHERSGRVRLDYETLGFVFGFARTSP